MKYYCFMILGAFVLLCNVANAQYAGGIGDGYAKAVGLISFTGIQDYDASSIYFTPNPVNDIVYIRKESTTNIEKIKLFDVFGNQVINVKKPQSIQSIDVSVIKPGIYFIIATTSKGVYREKLLKQ